MENNGGEWQPKYIVLDSNELIADIGLTSTRAAFLRAYCERRDVVIVVPSVVRLEVESHIESKVSEVGEALREAARTLERYGAHVPSDYEPVGSPYSLTKAKGQFAKRLQWLGARDMPLPSVTHSLVVARLLRHRRPFSNSKYKDVGYRDFLLWRNVLSLDGATAFVTTDSDFREKTDLHPDLARDLERNGREVRLFNGLRTLTDSILRPAFPTLDATELLLDLDHQRKKIEEFAANAIEPPDMREFLSLEDIASLIRQDTASQIPSSARVVEANVSGVYRVALGSTAKDIRSIDGETVSVTYYGDIDHTVRATFEWSDTEWNRTEMAVVSRASMEYILDVGGTEIVPRAVSLESLTLT